MFGWFRELFETHDAAPGQPPLSRSSVEQANALMAAGTTEVGGLNFKAAIEAHVNWKSRLHTVIDGSNTEQLDPRIVGMDNRCELGKWIYSDGGSKFGDYPRFKSLCVEHAKFHSSAASVLKLALSEKSKEAVMALENGEYQTQSLKVTRELAALFVELATKE